MNAFNFLVVDPDFPIFNLTSFEGEQQTVTLQIDLQVSETNIQCRFRFCSNMYTKNCKFF